jgi:outer membrane protein assembly factor BamB
LERRITMENGSRFAVLRPARACSNNHTKRVAKVALFLCVSLAIGLSSVRTASAAGVTLTLSITSGPPTTNLLVSGGGFPASTAVDIYFDTTDVALAVTSAMGAFSGIALKVPAAAVPGTHWVTGVARGTSGKAAQASFLVQTNWAQFQYSNLHKGVNPFENVLSPTTVGSIDLDWSYATGASIRLSAAAVVNGVVYVGSLDNNLYALNASTGALLWKYTTGSWVASSPTVANGVVYVGSLDHNLYALNASTGALLWKYTAGNYVVSSPAVANGVVYVGSDDDNLYALNASTGALLWKYTTTGLVESSPAVANGVVYVGSVDDNLYALNASTGALLWKYTTGNSVYSSPAVANGVVYVGSDDDNLYALNAHAGNLLWKYTTGSFVLSSPAVANGVVYVGSYDDNLYALNAHTGTLLWKYTTLGTITDSSPTVANGVVYVGSDDNNLYTLDARTGSLLWQYTTGNPVYSPPVEANGVVYVGSYDGSLYAFDLSGGTLAKRFRAPDRPDPRLLRPDLSLQPAQPVTNIPLAGNFATDSSRQVWRLEP